MRHKYLFMAMQLVLAQVVGSNDLDRRIMEMTA